MSNPTWVDQLDRAFRAGEHAILSFNVDDWALSANGGSPLRLPEHLASGFIDQGVTPIMWSLGTGVEPLMPPGTSIPSGLGRIPTGHAPEEVLPGLTALLRANQARVAVIIDHAEGIVPAAGAGGLTMQHQLALEVLHGWGLDATIRANRNHVVLISRQNQVHDLLRRGTCGYRTIQIDLPDMDQRRRAFDLLAELRAAGRTEFAPIADDTTAARLADVGGGLRLDDIFAAARDAAVEGVSLSEQMLVERKRQALRAQGHDLIEVHQPAFGFNGVANLDHVIAEFRSYIETGRFPTGLLLVGPPGVGKSFVVEALAFELGWTMVSLRNIREQWVGASERNLEIVLWLIDNLSPCIVRLDEIDQLLGQRSSGGSGDSGTSERILARLWEFMGETVRRRKVMWVGTSNRPDLIDSATLDRCPVIIPFLHPTPTQLPDLIRTLAKQSDREVEDDLTFDTGLPGHDLVSARLLTEVLGRAATNADRRSGRPNSIIDSETLNEAVRDHRPKLIPDFDEFLGLTAVAMTSFRSLLPWNQPGADPAQVAPAYVNALLDEGGQLDEERLRRRLLELERHIGTRSASRVG